jgi:hypothetical protein
MMNDCEDAAREEETLEDLRKSHPGLARLIDARKKRSVPQEELRRILAMPKARARLRGEASFRYELPVARGHHRARRTLTALQVRNLTGADSDPFAHLALIQSGIQTPLLEFLRSRNDSQPTIGAMRYDGGLAGLHRQLVKQTAARPTNGGQGRSPR